MLYACKITHPISQAERSTQEIDASNSSQKWQAIAYKGIAPLQKEYLAAVDVIANGTASLPLRKAVYEAGVVLKQLLELEKKAQYCYIDAQLCILENNNPNSDTSIEGKKRLKFHFFCSHVSAEMATHVSATAMGLEQLGCVVWTDQMGRLDIDAFGMVK